MNENSLNYQMKLDASQVVEQLKKINELFDEIEKTLAKQSGKTFAINVQITNQAILDVFDRLNRSMKRTEDDAEKLSSTLERALGKEKTIDRLTKSISQLTETLERAAKDITKSITAATSGTIEHAFKENTKTIMRFTTNAENSAKKMARKIAAETSAAFRQMKKELEAAGLDVSNMSAKDLENLYAKLSKQFNKRQVANKMAKSFEEGWSKAFDNVAVKAEKAVERSTKAANKTLEAQRKQALAEEALAARRREAIDEAAEEREKKRIERYKLYVKNVREANNMLRAQVEEGGTPDEQKLTAQYNRAVQRIRGIYQAAIVHGRVENPQTILAGLTELQQRSLALNNFKLKDQMGINDLNRQLSTTVKRVQELGTIFNKVSSVVQNTVQAFSVIQNYSAKITSTLTNLARNVISQVTSKINTFVSQSTEAFKSLEISMIGFRNFFGEESADRIYQRIKSIAAEAPGLGTTDLADYVRQIAPVSNHNADLALDASLGMLKTIQYGGAAGSTEMEYVIKNIRDVISKGEATKIDVRQFNRAMPILEEVLKSVGQSQLLKDGELTINKDNVDTILSAFAALNNSNQSAVKDIFSTMNNTLSGQWEQFTEQFTTNLMETLRGSQVYGGVQNILSQINNGAYINTGLLKLQEALSDFINNINWFKLQRIAGEILDGMKIIWEGIKDAAANIASVLGQTNTKSIITSFSQWIADIVRGMGDGIAQVIRFLQNLERSGVMSTLSRWIGWFGSVGAKLTQTIATVISHGINLIGNATQLFASIRRSRITRNLTMLNEQLEAIPISARSQLASGSDLLNGTGVVATTEETAAINNLTHVVQAHLTKIEANQSGSSSTLGRVETAVNNGNRYVWSDDYNGSGTGAIGKWNKKTKNYDWTEYPDTKAGYNKYKELTTQNRLKQSNSAFLRAIGNNKVVDTTLKGLKSIGSAIMGFVRDFFSKLGTSGIVFSLTTLLTSAIDALDMFGENTVYVSGIIKTAGLAISGAILGSSLTPVGGVVGALIGLGIGLSDLTKAVKDKADELTNTQITEALDEEHQNILNSVKDALIKNDALSGTLNERTNEENYALQQLERVIANTSTMELEALGGRGLADVYGDALRYKTIQENFTNKNTGKGFDWSEYATGAEVTKDNKEYLRKIYDLVNKYDLLSLHGYSQGVVEGQRVYVDSSGNPISAETIWDEFFNSQGGQEVVTSDQIDAMQTYLENQESEQRKRWEEIEKKLEGISNTPGQSWYDLIDSRLREANNHLLAIQSQNPTKESMSAIYGETAGNSFENYKNATASMGGVASGVSQTNLRELYKYANGTANSAEQFLGRMIEQKYGAFEGEPKTRALALWAADHGMETDALYYDLNNDEISRIYDLLSGNWKEKVGTDTILNKLNTAAAASSDIAQRQRMEEAKQEISTFDLKDDTKNLFWWLRLLLKKEAEIGGGFRFFAHGGPATTPAYRGVDTVPAMLSPGEFVMKPSAVRKAGLGMMYALNRGDLGAAARSLSSSVNNNWYKNNNSSVNNSRNTKTNINNIRIFNRNASARLNTYYSLANRLSF